MTNADRAYYEEMKRVTSPKGSSEHGHDCKCQACYEEWACSTGFETMNPEGRERMKIRREAQRRKAND